MKLDLIVVRERDGHTALRVLRVRFIESIFCEYDDAA
jgi:hypothetical protein